MRLLITAVFILSVHGTTHRIANEYYRLGVTVNDAAHGGHTHVSELQLNQDQFGFGWTANLLFNFSQGMGVSNRGRLSGTALVTLGSDGTSVWHAPTGGSVSLHNATAITVASIELGSAADEEWRLALDGPNLTWAVRRVVRENVEATCDRMPTLVFNAEYTTTGHVLRTSAQVPSFLDATLRWDPLSGVGFQCDIGGYPANRTKARTNNNVASLKTSPSPGAWTEALTNTTTQRVLLSPSSLKFNSRGGLLRTGASAASAASTPPLMFALTYPTTPGTGGGDTVMALGFTTMQPPSHAPVPSGAQGWWGEYIIVGGVDQFYVPPANTTKYHILASDCGTVCFPGMPAACSVTLPVSSAAAAALANGGSFACSRAPHPPAANTTGATPLRKGETVEVSWSLELGDGHGVAPFVLETGDADLDYNLGLFANVYNMWAGNIFGNSPASIVCLHEMSWFPMIASAFDSALGPNSVHSALASELLMFAEHAVQDNGFIYARWNQGAYINMTIHDQMPHFILANYYQVVNTGDKAFLAAVWPALNKAMGYVLRGGGRGMGMGSSSGDGLATTPTAGGVPGEDHADNWLDIVNFGGKDAIINTYLITALNAMAEMAIFLGGENATSEAAAWQRLHAKAAASFEQQFWNASASLYSDWIDIRGGRRNYFYVWQQFNAIDRSSGLVNASRAKQMLASIDRYTAEIRVRYNKTEDELWCTPTNLDTVRGDGWSGLAPFDGYQHGELQDQKHYGHYENGCCFMVMLGMELAARGEGGDPDGAMVKLQRAMARFNTTRFWGQHYDWCVGDHCDQPPSGFNGADVIANSAMILYGAAHALFGFRTDLHGVHVYGRPASALKEGATHRFIHLGLQVELKVVCRPTCKTTIKSSPSTLTADLDRIREFLTNATLASCGASTTADARKYSASLLPNGTWSDIDYRSKSPGDWSPETHVVRIETMSIALSCGASKHDETMEVATHLAMQFWFQHDLQSPNWWNNDIGCPRTIGNAFLVLQQSYGAASSPFLTPTELAGGLKMMKRAVWGTKWTGANLVDMAMITNARACIVNNATLASVSFAAIWSEIYIAHQEDDDIQLDASFHQHSGGGRGALVESYGAVFTSDVGKAVAMSAGTHFAPDAATVEIFAQHLLDGQRWMLTPSGTWDYSVMGRSNSGPSMLGVPEVWADLALALPVRKNRSREVLDFAALLRGEADAPSGPTGNKMFWCSDYMVHRTTARTNVSMVATLRMYSNRTIAARCVNMQGRHNQHSADGVLNLFFGDARGGNAAAHPLTGDAYYDITPVRDPRRLPGVTCETNATLLACNSVESYNAWPEEMPGTPFVGGASDGVSGTAAMHLESGTMSKKGANIFSADGTIIVMGAELTCNSSSELRTTLASRILPRGARVHVGRSGEAGRLVPLGGVEKIPAPDRSDRVRSWVHLEGRVATRPGAALRGHSVAASDIGYVLLLPTAAGASGTASNATRFVAIEQMNKTGSWSAIGTARGNITRPVFEIGWSHGPCVCNGAMDSTFAYAIFPAAPLASMPSLANTLAGKQVLVNTADVQAVLDAGKAEQTLHAVFWSSSTDRQPTLADSAPAGWKLTVDAPMIVVATEVVDSITGKHGVRFAVSSPVVSGQTVTLTLDREGLVSGEGCSASGKEGKTTSVSLALGSGDSLGRTSIATCFLK